MQQPNNDGPSPEFDPRLAQEINNIQAKLPDAGIIENIYTYMDSGLNVRIYTGSEDMDEFVGFSIQQELEELEPIPNHDLYLSIAVGSGIAAGYGFIIGASSRVLEAPDVVQSGISIATRGSMLVACAAGMVSAGSYLFDRYRKLDRKYNK